MEALVCIARFPFYSFRRKSYQVRSALLLPPPSALKGALAKGLIQIHKKNGNSIDELAIKTINQIENKLVYVGAKLHESSIIKSEVLLKRLRNLEGSNKKSKDTDGKEDAMRREYIFARELLIIYIFKDNLNDKEKNILLKAIYLIDNFGDSECIGNIIDARWARIKKEEYPVNTYFKLNDFKDINGGIVELMFTTPRFNDQKEHEELYLLPLIEKYHHRYTYYVESSNIKSGNYKIEVFNKVIGLWIQKT